MAEPQEGKGKRSKRMGIPESDRAAEKAEKACCPGMAPDHMEEPAIFAEPFTVSGGVKRSGKVDETDAANAKAILQAASAEAAERLVALMRSSDPRVALSATNALLDRVEGKSTSRVDARVEHAGRPDLQAEIRAALLQEQILRKTGGGDGAA